LRPGGGVAKVGTEAGEVGYLGAGAYLAIECSLHVASVRGSWHVVPWPDFWMQSTQRASKPNQLRLCWECVSEDVIPRAQGWIGETMPDPPPGSSVVPGGGTHPTCFGPLTRAVAPTALGSDPLPCVMSGA
jgi:hypothetical protein